MLVSHNLLSTAKNAADLIIKMSSHFRISPEQFGFLTQSKFTFDDIKSKDKGNGVKFYWACYRN